MNNKFRFLTTLCGMVATVAVCSVAASCTVQSGNKATTYTITFDANGGVFSDTEETTKTVKVKDGKQVTEVPEVSKEGYDFLGWYDEYASMPINFENYIVSYAATFYAHFGYSVDPSKEYTDIEANASVEVTEASFENAAGYKMTVAEAGYYKVTVEGEDAYDSYVAIGIAYTDGDDGIELDRFIPGGAEDNIYYLEANTYIVEVAAPLTFKFAPCTAYTVTFDANGGDFYGLTSYSVIREENTGLPEYIMTPAKEGYIFSGWYSAPENDVMAVDVTNYIVTYDATLYAYYTDASSIDPSADYETISVTDTVTVEDASWEAVAGYKMTVSEDGYYKVVVESEYDYVNAYNVAIGTDYELSFWGDFQLVRLNSNGAEDNIYYLEAGKTYIIEVDNILTFNFEACEVCALTLNANGGYFYGEPAITTLNIMLEVGGGLPAYLDVPYMEGKVFAAWCYSPDGDVMPVNTEYYTITEDTTLYATYTDEVAQDPAEKYVLTLNVGEATTANPPSFFEPFCYTLLIEEDGDYTCTLEYGFLLGNSFFGSELDGIYPDESGVYHLTAGTYYVEVSVEGEFTFSKVEA